MMKKVLFGALLLVLSGFFFSFTVNPPAAESEIKWMTWEEAIAANNKTPKKIFVDVYTDWCGWCKRMDKTTFADQTVIEYMNEHFYAVKLDAEQKEDINYDGNTFKFVASGRRGVHELAYALLDGRLGYPSYVYLSEQQERITISPGYKDVDGLMKEMRFIAEDHFKTTSFQDFVNKSK